ncbi:MAG: hypothetical protein KIT84_01780 [Labilithrix sp.]|nr:hypothetical protein [Labilithrix sp.]MCW5809717.1 hypothetical protein [Labilithrix sp.]
MLIGRPSSLPLLALVSAVSFGMIACSQSDEEVAGDAQEISADHLLTLDPSLPFEVTRVHVANGPVLGARWGSHNGPVTTTQNFQDPSAAPLVTRWFVPATVGAPMSQQPWSARTPEGLPTAAFWGADGFVDLPFGNVTLQGYTVTNEHSSGEVFLFSRNYDSVIARAHANGFYSGVGVTDGTKTRIVYSGLSGFTADPSTTSENALWASDVTASDLVPAGGSTKLFAWEGYSGPVSLDNGGNLFVAASRIDAEHKIAIYALTKGQTFASETTEPATIAEADTTGTASLAVASVPGSGTGWIFAKGYDTTTAPAPIYARAYTASADEIAGEGDVIAEAIKPASPNTSLSAFADPNGNLWVSVEIDNVGAWLVQLSPRAATPTP